MNKQEKMPNGKQQVENSHIKKCSSSAGGNCQSHTHSTERLGIFLPESGASFLGNFILLSSMSEQTDNSSLHQLRT